MTHRPALMAPLVGLVGAFAAAVVLVSVHGCGKLASGGCTEKATCPPADGATDSTGPGDTMPSRTDGATDATHADSEPPTDAGPSDAPVLVDAGGDACAACTLVPPIGWSLVAFAGATTVGCPVGFTTMDVREGPEGGTCSCGACQTITAPTCTTENFTSTVGTSCEDAGPSFAASGSSCAAAPGTLPGSLAIAGAQVAGNCAAPAVADASTVTSQSDRICVPPEPCLACNPGLSPDFEVCIMTPNNVACPAGTSQMHVVSPSYSLECTVCNCTLTGTCSGTLTFYTNTDCSGASSTLLTNGTCAQTSGIPFSSYVFDGGLTSTSCVSGTSTAAFEPTSLMTVCCP
jgi:hypothetical protein